MDTPDTNAKKPNLWEIPDEPAYSNDPHEPHGLFLDAVDPQVYSEEMQFDMDTYPATQQFTPEEELSMEQDFEEEEWYDPFEPADEDTGSDAEFDELSDPLYSDLAMF